MHFKIVSILRNLLGLVFVFSGVVSTYGILPDFLVLPFSFIVSFFEFAFGLMLVFGVGVFYALLGLISMVFVFTVFVFSSFVYTMYWLV